jgi:hypothetical protein
MHGIEQASAVRAELAIAHCPARGMLCFATIMIYRHYDLFN